MVRRRRSVTLPAIKVRAPERFAIRRINRRRPALPVDLDALLVLEVVALAEAAFAAGACQVVSSFQNPGDPGGLPCGFGNPYFHPCTSNE